MQDWNWCYQYEYPPLLEDLIKYVPYFDVELINKNESLPLPPLVQLSYVLPSTMCELLPVKVQNNQKKKYPEWYSNECEFEEDGKYFWSVMRNFKK